jgi:hypothetical protein
MEVVFSVWVEAHLKCGIKDLHHQLVGVFAVVDALKWADASLEEHRQLVFVLRIAFGWLEAVALSTRLP